MEVEGPIADDEPMTDTPKPTPSDRLAVLAREVAAIGTELAMKPRTRYGCTDCLSVTPAPHVGPCRSCSWTIAFNSTELASFRLGDDVVRVVEHVSNTKRHARFTVEHALEDDGFGVPGVELYSTSHETYTPAIFEDAGRAMAFALELVGWDSVFTPA